MSARGPIAPADDGLLGRYLGEMAAVYRENPERAVRSQAFIKLLHRYLGDELSGRLTKFARRRGIKIIYEAEILGSHKPKDVDVAVVDPENGPLLLVGIRSQMSSVGKNALNYYEGIIGECISLQDRFPLATHGYVYLMPTRPIKEEKENEQIDHARYARLYAAITDRSGISYDRVRGIYDEFAYMVVDFHADPPLLREDIVSDAVADVDLSMASFVDRLVSKFSQRMLFWDIFEAHSERELGR